MASAVSVDLTFAFFGFQARGGGFDLRHHLAARELVFAASTPGEGVLGVLPQGGSVNSKKLPRHRFLERDNLGGTSVTDDLSIAGVKLGLTYVRIEEPTWLLACLPVS